MLTDASSIFRLEALEEARIHFNAIHVECARQLDPVKKTHGPVDAQLIHVAFGKDAQFRHTSRLTNRKKARSSLCRISSAAKPLSRICRCAFHQSILSTGRVWPPG